MRGGMNGEDVWWKGWRGCVVEGMEWIVERMEWLRVGKDGVMDGGVR